MAGIVVTADMAQNAAGQIALRLKEVVEDARAMQRFVNANNLAALPGGMSADDAYKISTVFQTHLEPLLDAFDALPQPFHELYGIGV